MKDCICCQICNKNINLVKWTSNDCKTISSSLCKSCDIVFADKILDDSEYIDFYNEYNNNRNKENKELAIKRNICYDNDLKFINRNCNNYRNILDIGCGNGIFLSKLNCKNKTGYDIDTNIIRENNLKYSDINFIDNLDKINSYEEFDLIIFRGTFQYMRDLNYIIKFIDKFLKKNGYLIILSLPNKNSPLAEIQRENWSLYNPIEMFNIFSLTSIKKLFNNYNIIDTEFPYLDTPYADEKNDILNFRELITNNKQTKFAFWGSMMQIIFQK